MEIKKITVHGQKKDFCEHLFYIWVIIFLAKIPMQKVFLLLIFTLALTFAYAQKGCEIKLKINHFQGKTLLIYSLFIPLIKIIFTFSMLNISIFLYFFCKVIKKLHFSVTLSAFLT